MSIVLLPYSLLLMSILVGYVSTARNSLGVFTLAIVAGLYSDCLSWISVPSVICLGTLLWAPEGLRLGKIQRLICYALFLILAIAMSIHLLPGFNNLLIYKQIQFADDSIPFNMYLNFDKTSVGLFIALFFTRTAFSELNAESIKTALVFLMVLVGIILPIAVCIHYVRLDLKFPTLGWLWIINNLFFVCLAEEGFFRGFIQSGLERILPKTKTYSGIAILISAACFGLAHYKGGLAYVGFAGISSLFYGYVFQMTKRLEAPIVVHFGLNLIHFLMFSYPAIIK